MSPSARRAGSPAAPRPGAGRVGRHRPGGATILLLLLMIITITITITIALAITITITITIALTITIIPAITITIILTIISIIIIIVVIISINTTMKGAACAVQRRGDAVPGGRLALVDVVPRSSSRPALRQRRLRRRRPRALPASGAPGRWLRRRRI